MARPTRETWIRIGHSAIASLRRIPPVAWLGLFVVAFFTLSLELSSVRFSGFRIQTWDIGIFQQSLWSFNHGRGFFDAADYELNGVSSFLGIHPAFVMYPLGYFYGLVPSVYALFAIQSAAVALAAIPLYVLTSRLSGSPWKALLCSGMFLLWAPTLAATLFDFHLEAFLPLELFALVALWVGRRYLWAILPAAAVCLTLEVGPLLIVAAGLFFILESHHQAAGARTVDSSEVTQLRQSPLRRLGETVRKPGTLFGLLCLVGGFAAYLVLRYVEVHSFGGSSVLAAGSGALPSLIDPLQFGLGGFSLNWNFIAEDLFPAVSYWILLYALVAFIPLRAPRTLVLGLPWFGFTLIAQHTNYTLLGNQYGFVVAAAAFVGLSYGVSAIRFTSLRDALRSWWAAGPGAEGPGTVVEVPAGGPAPVTMVRAGLRTRSSSSLWTLAIIAAVAFNLALSPLDPLLADAPLGAGYKVDYSSPPEFGPIERAAALIPSNASLLASSDLFPYAANNVNAYTTVQTPYQPPPAHFPFSPGNPPRFVFVSQAWYPVLPAWLDAILWNNSHYGVRAVIGQSLHGWIFLFEHMYSGPVLNFLTPSQYPNTFYNAVDGMRPGPAGVFRPDPSAEGNTSIIDPNGAPGVVWMGPDVLMPAGNYSFFAYIRVWLLNSSVVPSTSVPLVKLWLSTIGRPSVCPTIVNLGTPLFGKYNSTNYQQENWTLVQVSRCVSNAGGFAHLTPDVQFVGLLASQEVGVQLNYVWLEPCPLVPTATHC